MRSFPAWRSPITTCFASPATPISRSQTTPPICSRPSRTSSGAGASARLCAWRWAPTSRRSCAGRSRACSASRTRRSTRSTVFSTWARCGRSSNSPATPSCATSLLSASPTRACSDTRASGPTCSARCARATSSFTTSVERFVEQAVADPNVLAIKQTVYRTSDDSPLVPALIDATERGKQAVALVELKARFDERMNIHWAKAMEEAGVHVVYGQPALKTHAKCVLVVRREGDGVRNYVHIGTGNYHSATARLYTDFGLFTTDEQIGADVADMFNNLTGYGRPLHYRKVLIAPDHLRDGIISQIEQTVAAHNPDSPSAIAMKMNSLVDGRCIRALYEASQAGVRVDLNVRGICCLRPGVEGVSENIRVVSIVGRLDR